MKKRALWWLAPVLAAGCIASAWAYRFTGSAWDGGQTTFFSGIPGVSPSGKPWAEAFREAMAVWNEKTPFRFHADSGYKDPCAGYRGRGSGGALNGNGDLYNGADFRSDVCGARFDDGTLAVTFSRYYPNRTGFDSFVESDIVFNANYEWDIYDGPPRQTIDFRRVAIHELGHALGLDHELSNPAIMQPQVSTLSDITADDIAGVNAIYSPGGGRTCDISMLRTNALIANQLSVDEDCRMNQLFGGTDTSFVDVYQVRLNSQLRLYMEVKASGFDPVILAFTAGGALVAIFEAEGCEVRGVTTELPPGNYYLMVNTYDQPTDCGAGEGSYRFSVSDSPLPVLGAARTFAQTTAPPGIMFQAGATSDGGLNFGTYFAAADSVDVQARIQVLPQHAGRQGAIYVVAILDDGRSFMKDTDGRFVPFSGRQADLQPAFRQTLSSDPMSVDIVQGLRGDYSGLAGHDFHVFIGYSVASDPGTIYYPNAPLSFRIEAP